MKRYSPSEIAAELAKMDQWSIEDGYLKKDFVFKDFSAAFGFLSQIALLAHELDHHPDWSGLYNKVTIRLKTHDIESVSEKDFLFALKIEEILN